MTRAAAVDLLSDLARGGHRLRLTGGRLLCRPAPPADLLPTLKAHRSELVAILQSDQRELFEERAAVMEFDGGLSRDEAEHLARLEVYGQAENLGPGSSDLCEDPALIKPAGMPWAEYLGGFGRAHVGGLGRALPASWTASGWARHLEYVAESCQTSHPQRAAELRAEAAAVHGGTAWPAVGHGGT